MSKAIVLDCFGVLYVNSGELFFQEHIDNYFELKAQLHDLSKQSDYGLISQAELVDQVAELSGLDKRFVRENIQGTHVLNTELLNYVQSLRLKYKIGLLSNISPGSMDQFFTPDQRTEYFDACVLSGEVGMVKPDPAVYELIADRLGLPTGECIMIDDNLDNCYGADAAGMQWIHYEDMPTVVDGLNMILSE